LTRFRLPLLESLAIFGLIMAYIWRFRVAHPWSWVCVLALILLSHILRRERPTAIGCRAQGFSVCLRKYGPPLLLIVAVFLSVALESGTLRPMTVTSAALSLGLYLPWGFFQQYLLNGYLLNRLESVLSPPKASTVAAGLFSLAHLPNWFLMIATLAGGLAANMVYRRHRNLYFLGIAHAILGFTIFVAAPDWMIHHLRIGPGWYRR
jgi:membrane protease YdiL (CAAX protease family)